MKQSSPNLQEFVRSNNKPMATNKVIQMLKDPKILTRSYCAVAVTLTPDLF